MISDPVRLYNAKGIDRVAVVSAEPAAGRADSFLIRLARGPKAGKLSLGNVFGPGVARFPGDLNLLAATDFSNSRPIGRFASELQGP